MKYKIINYWFVSIPVDFRLSWGKMGYSRHIFLQIENEMGKQGFGEGILYNTTFLNFLPYFKQNILTQEYFDSSEVEKHTIFEPALSFALDSAVRDASSEFLPLTQNSEITEELFIGGNISKTIPKFLLKKTKYVKLKVGQKISDDKNHISEINRLSSGKLKIKLDANRGYNFSEAKEISIWGKQNNVILIEEPMSGSFDQIVNLKKEIDIPIMLDESIKTINDLESAIKTDCFDILNIKLTRLGGISGAKKYVDLCHKANKKVSLGCSEELDIGMSVILNYAQQIKDIYGVEGYGPDRLSLSLGPRKDYIENLNALTQKRGYFGLRKDQNDTLFKVQELYGLWSTKLDNGFHLIFK